MLKDLTDITNGNRSGVHTPSSEAEVSCGLIIVIIINGSV